MPLKVSVVVPTYKRLDLLERCLQALLKQNFAFDQFEIIVADNAGSAEAKRLIENLAANTQISMRYIDAAQQQGPAFARNCGWQNAEAEIVAFTDDDTIPDRNWLTAAVFSFEENEEIAAITGKTVVPLPADPTDYQFNESGLATGEFVTANCFVRRRVLTQIGGFDARFTIAWREDSDLHFRLLENNYRIERIETALVAHPIRPADFGISLRQQRKTMFDALLFKKHPQLFREKIGFGAKRYYQIFAALIAAVCFARAENNLLTIIAFAVWLFLTAKFCALRLRHTSRRPLHVFEMTATSILIPPLAVFWRIRGAIKFGVLFY